MYRHLTVAALAALVLANLAMGSEIPTAGRLVQQSVNAGPFMIRLPKGADALPVGDAVSLDIFVMDAKTMAPRPGLKILATLTMPSMAGMRLQNPSVEPAIESGRYTITAQYPHAGAYRIDLVLRGEGGRGEAASFAVVAGAQPQTGHMHGGEAGSMAGMGHSMKGMLGPWSANREGSGTSWQPDDSPMFMKMLPKVGRYDLNLMGEVQAGYVDAGGKRGDEQAFANSMAMWMAQREIGGGILGLRLMVSADALTNGKRGVPNLFQTGETLHGEPLVDRQHPHDFLSEAAVSFSKSLGASNRGFLYLGPVGEPALGNSMFMHRASGMEIPEAPITHHWFDSTHIAFGVVTAGVTMNDRWKLEASLFNGHEPGENRFDIDPIRLDSATGRLSYRPDMNWSFSASYGFLESPEELEPGVDQHRLTASVQHGRSFANGDNWSTSLLFGRILRPGHKDSDAFVLESTYYHGGGATFGRLERVDKDELEGVPEGSYGISKLVLGHVRNLSSRDGFDLGLGGYVGLYQFPKALEPFYGKKPVTIGVFLRVRPSKM